MRPVATKRFFCLGLLLAALPCASARADTFYFTFNGSIYSGSGEFTAQATTYGVRTTDTYLVTAVTGSATYTPTLTTTPITGIAPLGGGFQVSDDILFYPGVNSNDFFTGHGVAFDLGNGTVVDLYAYSGIYLTIPGQGSLPDSGAISVTNVPEPSSLVLLGTPVLAALVRRSARLGRRRQS